jgi:hypothetical protein
LTIPIRGNGTPALIAEALAIKCHECAYRRPAEGMRFLQYWNRTPGAVAGRGIDNLEHLGNRALLGERLVTFRLVFRQLTLQGGYGAFALEAHLRTSSAVPPTADYTAMSTTTGHRPYMAYFRVRRDRSGT